MVELEVAPVADELATDSNRAVVNIEGVRDKLRVLLVSGKPHPGERMWRNLLKSDANVDLVHFTILRPPEKGGDGTPINELSLIAFPVADLFGRKIKDFDLIIFDRYAQQSILPYVYLDNIANYVRDGGALLMAEGPEFSTPDGLYYSPLGAIAPAEPTGEDVEAAVPGQGVGGRPAPSGDARPAGLDGEQRRAAWGRWFRLIGAKTDRRRDGDERPGRQAAAGALARRQGAGRPAAQRPDVALGARLRRRRTLPRPSAPARPLADEGAGARGRGAARQRQGARGDGRAPERERARSGKPDLVAPDGTKTKLTLTPVAPGLSRAHVTVDRFGLYRAEDGEHVALVNVGPDNPLEMQDVVSTTEKLRPIAEATGGTVRRLAAGRGDAIVVPRVVGLEPVAELRRQRLHRHQADRVERTDRRPLDFARVGLLRIGPVAGHGGRGLARRRRGVEARRAVSGACTRWGRLTRRSRTAIR